MREGVSLADFDEATYLPYLDGLGMTDAQASELLMILHDIMSRFVFLGWDVDLVCEYVFAEPDLPTEEGLDPL